MRWRIESSGKFLLTNRCVRNDVFRKIYSNRLPLNFPDDLIQARPHFTIYFVWEKKRILWILRKELCYEILFRLNKLSRRRVFFTSFPKTLFNIPNSSHIAGWKFNQSHENKGSDVHPRMLGRWIDATRFERSVFLTCGRMRCVFG